VFFLLDGYNILFSLVDSSKPFSTQRQEIITYLQKQFDAHHLSGMLVFDGSHRNDEESGRGYQSPLEVVFTPKGQNADSFILEKVSLTQNRKDVRVVTSDAGLTRQARSLGAHVMKNHSFLSYLEQKKKRPPEKKMFDNHQNRNRLQKIFEDRFLEY
jgi:predicted RNA-binding protein with PIN domain